MAHDIDEEWTLPQPISGYESKSSDNWEFINATEKFSSEYKLPNNFSINIDWQDQGEGDIKGAIRVVLTRGSMMTGEIDVTSAEFKVSHDRNEDFLIYDYIQHHSFFEQIKIGDKFRLEYLVGKGKIDYKLFIHSLTFKYWSE